MTTTVNRLMSTCSVTMVPSIVGSCRVPVAQEDIVQPSRHHTFSIHEVTDGLQHSLGVWPGSAANSTCREGCQGGLSGRVIREGFREGCQGYLEVVLLCFLLMMLKAS